MGDPPNFSLNLNSRLEDEYPPQEDHLPEVTPESNMRKQMPA
jgi:hypothetical protein